MIRSLCPFYSSPSPKMTMGVTLMMVMITMDAKMSRVMVESERQDINLLDLMLTVQFFFNCVSMIRIVFKYKIQVHQK